MAGDDASPNDYRMIRQPEHGLHANADAQRRERLDVAAAATEIGGFEAHGNGAAFGVDLDWNLHGVTGMPAAVIVTIIIGIGDGGKGGLDLGRIHGRLRSSARAG